MNRRSLLLSALAAPFVKPLAMGGTVAPVEWVGEMIGGVYRYGPKENSPTWLGDKVIGINSLSHQGISHTTHRDLESVAAWARAVNA